MHHALDHALHHATCYELHYALYTAPCMHGTMHHATPVQACLLLGRRDRLGEGDEGQREVAEGVLEVFDFLVGLQQLEQLDAHQACPCDASARLSLSAP